MGNNFSANHNGVSMSDEWLTPPEVLLTLGSFDLDPCAPVQRPWPTAKKHFTIMDDGLSREWFGRVWLNPPYGSVIGMWLKRMAAHKSGLALTFSRTDTDYFHGQIFNKADSLYFLDGRINFYTVAGTMAKGNGGAPSVLISWSEKDSEVLHRCGLKGKHIHINMPMIIVQVSPSWKNVVDIALTRLNDKATLERIYEVVGVIASDKLHRNKHYKAKVRQVLQKHFSRIKRGHYERCR